MDFQREKQSVSATDLLQAIANGDDIKLNQCTITGMLDINRLFDPSEKFEIDKLLIESAETCKNISLKQSIVFDQCTFEENVVFSAPWAEPDSVAVKFHADVIFNSSSFKAQTRFRNAAFEQSASFDGCTFDGVATFKNAVFSSDAKFRTVLFNGYSLFGNTTFESSARFTNAHFVKGVNFSQVQFLSLTDFNGVYTSSRAIPACDSIVFGRHTHGDDESFWRFVKQCAQEAGYYQLAGEYFYQERCASLWQKLRGSGNYDSFSVLQKLLTWLWAIRLLPEFIFGRLLFGYGERPTRVLCAAAFVILFCAFIFANPGALQYRDMHNDLSFSLIRGLYFSTITFTTLGYGDLFPAQDSFYRVIAMAEAISGAFLMALFVVCLAKRFSRG